MATQIVDYVILMYHYVIFFALIACILDDNINTIT